MPSFEEKLTALEALVERLERGELSLDESVQLFEEGVKLSDGCKAELEKAEGRIEVLVRNQNGTVRVEPLEVKDGEQELADESLDGE